MFELISGGPRHPFHDRTMTPTLVSVAGHVLVITGLLVIPLLYATERLPSVAATMAFVAPELVAAAPPPPPPPPPSNIARSKGASAQSHEEAPTAPAIPLDAPAGVAPEPTAVADAVGAVGGFEGGVIGGVVGGIVGGLVAAAPPPPPPPPVPPAPRTPVRIGGNIQAPILLHRVDPAYPDIAVVAKVGGMVILEATVGVDGAVDSVRLLRGIKFLDQAAMDAVKQWRYSPLVLNGVPTAFVLTVTLNFSVKDS
jgi:protein TonB